MIHIATSIGSLVIIGDSLPTRTNAVTYGQQLCLMLKSGIRLDEAWSCIAQEYTKSSIANPRTVIP